jgi:hypothetical protein
MMINAQGLVAVSPQGAMYLPPAAPLECFVFVFDVDDARYVMVRILIENFPEVKDDVEFRLQSHLLITESVFGNYCNELGK